MVFPNGLFYLSVEGGHCSLQFQNPVDLPSRRFKELIMGSLADLNGGWYIIQLIMPFCGHALKETCLCPTPRANYMFVLFFVHAEGDSVVECTGTIAFLDVVLSSSLDSAGMPSLLLDMSGHGETSNYEKYYDTDSGSSFTTTFVASSISVPTSLGCYNDYNVTASDVVVIQTQPDAWDTQDWSTIRDFPHAVVDRTGNTITSCMVIAKAHGSALFGLAKGIECW